MSNRFFYGCKAVNIYNSDLVLSGLNGFISGVQSVTFNKTSNLVELKDFYGMGDILSLKGPDDLSVRIERVISKEGDFFIKKGSQLFNELFMGTSQCKTHDLAIIFGNDNKPFVQEGEIVGVSFFPKLCITSIEYNIGISSPSIREVLIFDGKEVVDEIKSGPMNLLSGPENKSLFNRSDYFDHKHQHNPSVLPLLVEKLLERGGLQEINITIDIPYSDFTDVGTWNVNDHFRNRYVSIPIEISCSFLINLREPIGNLEITTEAEEERIIIEYGDFSFHLGPNNRLSSIEYGGGDVSGSIDQLTVTYDSRNVFRITKRE